MMDALKQFSAGPRPVRSFGGLTTGGYAGNTPDPYGMLSQKLALPGGQQMQLPYNTEGMRPEFVQRSQMNLNDASRDARQRAATMLAPDLMQANALRNLRTQGFNANNSLENLALASNMRQGDMRLQQMQQSAMYRLLTQLLGAAMPGQGGESQFAPPGGFFQGFGGY